MFADVTGMTGVILYLITTETKTPKNMTKCDGVGMTQTSMPEIDAGEESNRCSGGGGRRMHRIELVEAVTSVKYHPGSSALTQKPSSSNSTIIGFPRVKQQTEIRFLIR